MNRNQYRKMAREKKIYAHAEYIVKRIDYASWRQAWPKYEQDGLTIYITSYFPINLDIYWNGDIVFNRGGAVLGKINVYRPDIMGWEDTLERIYHEHLDRDNQEIEAIRKRRIDFEENRFPSPPLEDSRT